MNDFETTLRSALDADVDSDPHGMLDDVRRGARRRRTRRRAIVAGAAAAVLIVGSLGASRLLTDDGPEPADEPGATPSMYVWDIGASEDGLLVATYEADCECTVLWRRNRGEWERLHTVPETSVWLSMAPDGIHGILQGGAYPSTVEVTDDGGETWTPLTIEGPSPDDTEGGEIGVWASDSYFWLVDAGYSAKHSTMPRDVLTAWSGPLDDASVAPVNLPDLAVRDISAVGSVGDALVTVHSEGTDRSTLLASHDGGDTWQPSTWPCQRDTLPGYDFRDTGAVVTCDNAAGDERVVHYSTDLTSWDVVARWPESLRTWGVGAGSALLVTADEALLATPDGVKPLDAGFEPLDVRHVESFGDRIYVATSREVHQSLDGGMSWEQVED